MKTTQILIAGFGGQGILFSGKFIAYKGLVEELQVSWLPSYGPEMRGGTANCNVILSDSPVGSPIITSPDVLIAMNLPSLEKYVNSVVKNRLCKFSVLLQAILLAVLILFVVLCQRKNIKFLRMSAHFSAKVVPKTGFQII